MIIEHNLLWSKNINQLLLVAAINIEQKYQEMCMQEVH